MGGALLLALTLAAAAAKFSYDQLRDRLGPLHAGVERVRKGQLGEPIQDPLDDEVGRLAASLDRLAEHLQEEQARQVRADETRRRLLADVSHELATPLTSIRATAETLLDSEVTVSDEERRSYLEDLLGEARRLDFLIKDLFELTRLESDGAALAREELDWAALCRHTVERYRSRFERAGLDLRMVEKVEEAWVSADGRRLEQVLENLLANSLRYVTAPGCVTVRIEARSDPARFRMRVIDDGPGIPETDLAHIFDRFYRSDQHRSAPGSGLGLAIVKEFVERQGGRVRAANRDPGVGTGAVISVELPALTRLAQSKET